MNGRRREHCTSAGMTGDGFIILPRLREHLIAGAKTPTSVDISGWNHSDEAVKSNAALTLEWADNDLAIVNRRRWLCHIHVPKPERRYDSLHEREFVRRSDSVKRWRAVWTCVHLSRIVRLFTANERPVLESPIFAHICKFSRCVRRPIFIKIFHVLDLHFQGQRFESSTLGSKRWQIGQTLLSPAQKVTRGLSIGTCAFNLGLFLKVRVNVIHISTANISQMVTERANVAIADK